MFATILRIGLRSDYLSLIEDRNMAALSEMKTSRMMAEKLLTLDPTYYDAYLAVGVENYMLSLKSAPARWLLRLGGAQTDKDRGVAKMKLAAQHGHYLPTLRTLAAGGPESARQEPCRREGTPGGTRAGFSQESPLRDRTSEAEVAGQPPAVPRGRRWPVPSSRCHSPG